MGSGGWKRVALGGNKKGLCKRKTFGLPKKRMFSAHAMLTNKEKLFLSAPRQLLPTAPKLTRSCKFHPQKPTVSLQYTFSFSKKHQSCVCTTATLSHRFKAFSPALCGQNRFRHVPPENFAKFFFDRALNRGRRTESRVLFGHFLHAAKSDNPFSLAGRSEILQTSNQPAAAAASYRNN